MSKIKIGSGTKVYEVDSFQFLSDNLLYLKFSGAVPTRWGSTISIIGSQEEVQSEITGFATIYQKPSDKEVILSNDESVYTDIPVFEAEPEVVDVDEVRAKKREEISYTCNKIIQNGVDVDITENGNTVTKHFSLTVNDQLNLFGKQAQLAQDGESGVFEYHSDGEGCKFFSYANMKKVIETAMAFVSYHTTYCNSFFIWLAALEDPDFIQNLQYGEDIPVEYQSEVLQAYIAKEAQ